MSVAHNLSVSSNFFEEQERYMHHLTVVISDLNDEKKTIDKSEQFNMVVAPVMEPTVLVDALRSLATSIEEYITPEIPNDAA